MKEEVLQRVRTIGSDRKWRSVDAVETEFLTADKVINLTIRTGTLTMKERDVINHHIIATIKMLEQLPCPKHLKNVPKTPAGTMNGLIRQFFPKKLRFDFITPHQVAFAMHNLNHRPRKCLGFETPHEVFMKQLHSRHNVVALQT